MAGYISHPYPDPAELLLIKTDKYGNIPEFPSCTILPLLIVATMVVIIVRNKFSRKGLT